jgi:hypothetical protein
VPEVQGEEGGEVSTVGSKFVRDFYVDPQALRVQAGDHNRQARRIAARAKRRAKKAGKK